MTNMAIRSLLVGVGCSRPQPEGWGMRNKFDAPAFRRGWRSHQLNVSRARDEKALPKARLQPGRDDRDHG